MKQSIIPIFIPHLGCPNDCVFCNQRRIAAPRVPTPCEISYEIEQGLKWAKNPQIAFYGGSFTAIPTRAQEEYLQAAFAFIQQGRASAIRLSTRPDCVDDETITRLKKYGVKVVELGAQSMSDKLLKSANRGHSSEDTIRAAKLINESGLELVLQMMVGLPDWDRQTELYTANALAALSPKAVRIYPVCVIEDTALCDMYRSGEYTPLDVQTATDVCADVLDIFERANIPAIRIGLNPTEELSNGGVVAGAYHPSMGELVRGELFFRQMTEQIIGQMPTQQANVYVPKGKMGLVRGQKNININRLTQHFPNVVFNFIEK